MNFAQKAARERGEVIVVEGYMDAIALAQAGFPQVVAPLGTALTEEQIEILWRMAPEPILCFDGDEAGQKAAAKVAERVLPILKPGLSLNFVQLVNEENGGKEDPDSYLRKHSPQEFRSYLDNHKTPLSGILWQILKRDRLFDTPERRAGFRSDINGLTNLIVDKATREEYRAHFLGLVQQMHGVDVAGMRTAPGQRRQWSDDDGIRAVGGQHYTFFEWRFLPKYHKEWGGEARRIGLNSVRRHPVELFLATTIHHPNLLYKYIENLKSLDMTEPAVDRLRNKLIRLTIEQSDLTGTSLWSLLVQEGFGDYLDTLSFRTHVLRFSLPTADDSEAETGLVEIIGILNEYALRQEWDAAAKRWAEDPTEENLERFEALRDIILNADSRRRDLDPIMPTHSRAIH
jgi:DNA primase